MMLNAKCITVNERSCDEREKMDRKKIERINELARKKKEGSLTEAEKTEQARLRHEYLAEFRENMKAMLDNTIIQEPDGTRHPLKQRDNPPVQ